MRDPDPELARPEAGWVLGTPGPGDAELSRPRGGDPVIEALCVRGREQLP